MGRAALASCGGLILAGCAASDCEPKVRGGSPTQAQAVSSASEELLERLKPHLNVCVRKIRLTDKPLPNETMGGYRGKTIWLEVPIWPIVVYHEYCHAIQRQNDLSVQGSVWDSDVGDPPTEVFALACEQALISSFLLGDRCPDDPDGVDALFETRELFAYPNDEIAVGRSVEFIPTAIIADDGMGPIEIAVASNGIVVVADGLRVELDPMTGAPVNTTDAEVSNGYSAITSNADVYFLQFLPIRGPNTLRRIWSGDEGLAGMGCLEEQERLFSWADLAWSAFRKNDSITVGWWRVE